jgi:two-component system, NtrC family, nitrogen regulation sensor histidine kinase NtrY
MPIFRFTLRTRIYLSMLAIILISFLVTGGIAIYDHYEQKAKYDAARLERKEKAVRASLDYFLNQLGGHIATDSVPYVFSEKICELSDVHNLFIVLYDLRGNMLISTNSMAMDSLGVPETVPYAILKQLSVGNDRAVTDHTLAKGQRSLAYWRFTDNQGTPIAITNVVYESMPEDTKDIFIFLIELGQSYILLFLLAALIAYFLSTYITRSLETIGTHLKNTQFGTSNEQLEWSSNDEIGALVVEYNRMLRELEKSAQLLAREERESAWREMAQQVAHEIKNPLTPMKLRVQQLERSWRDNAPEFSTKLQLFTKSMTEQIDTLAHIASEFSSFAKMPPPRYTSFDLVALAREMCELYSHDNVQLHLYTYGHNNLMVRADKDHVIRVFNNLISNGIQATPHQNQVPIYLSIRPSKDLVLVRVNDKGAGISDDKKQQVFTPKFTTKSTGSGLGLVMVKNMIQQMGGKIWFWSKPNKGASFFFTLNRSTD